MISILVLTIAHLAGVPDACKGPREELLSLPREERAERISACSILAVQARAVGLDPFLAVEVAWSESRWDRRAVNKRSGCRGILQYDPSFWGSGLEAISYYRTKHPQRWRAVCDFKRRGTPKCRASDPKCCPRSKEIDREAKRRRASR